MSDAGQERELLIGNLFRRNAEQVPDRVAASLGEERLSHSSLNQAANRMAQWLRDRGIRHGDRVATWSDTNLEVLPLFAALAKLGAIFAPVNARLGVAEAAPVLALARPSLVVGDAAHAGTLAELAKTAGVDRVARLGGDGDAPNLIEESAAAPADEIHEPALRERDPHVLFFTSGSTGAPKGVVLSHRANYLRSFQGVFHDEPERSICMFPLFHMAAFTLALSAWQTRGEIAFVHNASAEEILAAVERRRGNRLYCIPAVWRRILDEPEDRFDTSSLRELDTGTSATPIELLRALKARFPNTRLRIYYGSTEVGAGTMLPDADVLRKPGSVGFASAGVDLRRAEDGEILLRGPYLCDGYFENEAATAEALSDGWFHTGDLGVLDAEGYVSILGRKKELIRSGGEGIAPSEVEAVLATHPEVGEVAVVGLPDPDWGEVVCAAIVADGGATPSLESLQQHCEGKLAGFKKPRRVVAVAALPRTAATGQVQRALLVEQIQSQLHAAGGAA